VSAADDRLVKVWDYQNKACVQTLEGHAQNVSCVIFHPELPIILSGSEDGENDTHVICLCICLPGLLHMQMPEFWRLIEVYVKKGIKVLEFEVLTVEILCFTNFIVVTSGAE